MIPSPRQDAPRLHAVTGLAAGHATLSLAGEIDLDTVPRLRRAMGACLRHRPTAVHLDISDVAFCDCAGLNALLWARAQADCAPAAFELRGPVQPPVARLLDLTGTAVVLGLTPAA
jgi:anti-sigma B factor antagonist